MNHQQKAALIARWRSDPAEFQADVFIPSAHGKARFGDVMAAFQRICYADLNPSLVALANGEKPPCGRYWWERTKGGSKDSDLAIAVLWLLMFSRRPLLIQVGASDKDQAAELRKAASDIVHLNPMLAERVDIKNWQITCDATGGVCEIVASDDAGSHGARPDMLVLNELSHVTKDEFASNLMDNAAKVPQGIVAIATNAGYTGTWQYKWRRLAESSDRWTFHTYSRPAPWLDDAEIAEAEQRNTQSRYRRLWWGVWQSGSGDAIAQSYIDAAIVQGLEPLQRSHPEYGFIGGLDLGVKKDRSALVILARHKETLRIRLARVQQWKPSPGNPVDLDAVQAAVEQASRDFGDPMIGFDPSQALLMSQQLTKRNVSMHEVPFTGANLDKMATAMLDTFSAGRIDMFPHAQLVADIRRLTITENPRFGYKLASTRDASGHADTATALAIALMLERFASTTGGGGWGGVTPDMQTRLAWESSSALPSMPWYAPAPRPVLPAGRGFELMQPVPDTLPEERKNPWQPRSSNN